jgi:CrcB protein
VTKLVLIAVGGGIGSVGRYWLGGVAQRAVVGAFPVGTLAVNLLGSLVIGVLAAYFAGPQLVREEYRLAIMVGVLGGFTTFSTFSLETFAMINDAQFARAAGYVSLSVVSGLVLAGLGYRLGQALFGG